LTWYSKLGSSPSPGLQTAPPMAAAETTRLRTRQNSAVRPVAPGCDFVLDCDLVLRLFDEIID
jgi:hypothetical protein